jgi:hypothetical protein
VLGRFQVGAIYVLTAIEYAVFRVLRLFRKLPFNPLSLPNQKVIFAEYFKGFGKNGAVKGIFGEKTDEILDHLTVEISWIMGYMYVDGSDGHLVISKSYMNGLELFDPRYDYVDRPTEIEAYRYAVKEARRLGLSEEKICCYLRTEWMSDADFARLCKSVDVQISSAS